ncbi:hypothetical protein [Mesorhizobium cantuariense]|uniref:Solute-binding protein family 5 domain-containing protein n=1 Tax=Mesorhizobium cantuariense TaxID=1300275 RepID=A0ABV7MTZ8_9HYPH
MRTMTKAFLSGSALLSAGLFMTSLPSAAMAQEATFALPAGELGATSYNPVTSSNLNSATSLIYDRLIEQDADQSFHPHLATSWQESPDGMTWEFKLHPGVNSMTASSSTPRRSQPGSRLSPARRMPSWSRQSTRSWSSIR